MVHYIKPDWLEDICRPDCPNNLAPLLVEVLATVLDNEVIFKIDFIIMFYIFYLFCNIGICVLLIYFTFLLISFF